MQVSPPVPGASRSRAQPTGVDVKSVLSTHFTALSARTTLQEEKQNRVFRFRVRKPNLNSPNGEQFKTKDVKGKDLILQLKRRVMTVDLNGLGYVNYGSKTFPGPDKMQRLSIVLDNDLALDFFFDGNIWKGRSSLRLYFKSMRERDLFADLFMALKQLPLQTGGSPADQLVDTADSALPPPVMLSKPSSKEGSRTNSSRTSRRRPGAPDPETKISVYVGTWNIGNEAVPGDLSAWIQPGIDVYVVAGQETSLTRTQQREEVIKNKQQAKVARGETLLEQIASDEADVQTGATIRGIEAKAVRKRVAKAIKAATAQEMDDKEAETRKLGEEYDKLSKEAKVETNEGQGKVLKCFSLISYLGAAERGCERQGRCGKDDCGASEAR